MRAHTLHIECEAVGELGADDDGRTVVVTDKVSVRVVATEVIGDVL
jgi:hypothetical protein